MKHTIDLRWIDKMAFETEVNGHTLILDAGEDVGGEDRGPRPKQLMLVSLAGCTGMDVVSILKKMRVELDYFNVRVEGDVREEHPKKYETIRVIYEFKGKELDIEKLNKAVKLSEEKYCGVRAVYESAIKITSEIKVLE
ncbi:MAG: OsmC family protein [Bacteroidales bacterium]|nr:OsmC family protein [Bacteroidales bacterium]